MTGQAKTLTDAGISRLNDRCAELRDLGECDGDCDVLGAKMGWCSRVWQGDSRSHGKRRGHGGKRETTGKGRRGR